MFHDGVLEREEYEAVRAAREAWLSEEVDRDHAWVRRYFAVVRDDEHNVVASGCYWSLGGGVAVECAIVFDFWGGRVSAFAAYLGADTTGGRSWQEAARHAADQGLKLREQEARGMLERHERWLAGIPYRV